MTRPQRQIVDVPPHPGRHQPHRPGWWCVICGDDWPCAPHREHLLSSGLTRAAVIALMESYYPQAVVELGDEQLVDRRLFAWARHGGPRRPAGGPW